MTIRRRVYLSNILMVVLPVVICILVVGIISSLLMGAFGISRSSYRDSTIGFVQDARAIAAEWADNASTTDVEQSLLEITGGLPATGATLRIYRDSRLLFGAGEQLDQTLDAASLASGGNRTYITDDTVITVESVGVYTLVGMRENPAMQRILGATSGWPELLLVLLALGGMACIIILVNLMLTRKIFRHIMLPLETLVDGVYQIAEGNLAYRIYYEGKDEFSPVIANFNDMAARLQDMVTARQKDDESRRELIAGISHDLRTPLTSIIGYVEGLEKGVASSPAMQSRYLAIIRQQADTLSHTINQLFLIAKLDTDSFPMRIEEIDLAAELNSYQTSVAEAYTDKGLSVHFLPPALPLWVQADRLQLRNVLTNVLENSAKYGKKDGGRMEIRCTTDKQSAVITMTDDGPGVTPVTLEKLFTVFYRSDTSRHNSKDGSGLGLAISARIVQRLGGTIVAENAVPNGLTIRITLPLAHKEESHAENIDR